MTEEKRSSLIDLYKHQLDAYQIVKSGRFNLLIVDVRDDETGEIKGGGESTIDPSITEEEAIAARAELGAGWKVLGYTQTVKLVTAKDIQPYIEEVETKIANFPEAA